MTPLKGSWEANSSSIKYTEGSPLMIFFKTSFAVLLSSFLRHHFPRVSVPEGREKQELLGFFVSFLFFGGRYLNYEQFSGTNQAIIGTLRPIPGTHTPTHPPVCHFSTDTNKKPSKLEHIAQPSLPPTHTHPHPGITPGSLSQMEVKAKRRTRRAVVGTRSSSISLIDLTPSASPSSGLTHMITFTTLLPLLLLINSFILLAAAQTQTTPIPVIGVTTGVDANTGQRPIRRNVNDLYARGGPQW